MGAASNFDEFVQAVSQDWAHVVATDFPTRAKALAAEILRAKPDVVGLQEVSLWRDQDVSDIVTVPPVTVTGYVRSAALFGPPPATHGSKFDSTVVPLIAILKTRFPHVVK